MIVALGQAVSMLGSHGVQFALIWWLAEKTSSPLMLGISGIVAYLPMTLFSPLAGIAADRYNRKFISIFSDMAMGTIALIYAVLLFFFDLPVWTVFVMLCVRGIGSTFQQPAIQSIIPQLVPKNQLVKTNGWMQLLNSGSFLLGPVIGASLYAIFPMSIVLMSDVAGAILASIALAVAKIPKLEKAERKEQHFIAEIKEGLQVFKEDKNLFYIVIAEALCMFFYAPLSSFYPLMTSDYFKLSAMYGSAVELSFAIGMMVSCGVIFCNRHDGILPFIFQYSKDKPENQSFFYRFVCNGSYVADLRYYTACLCWMVFLCRKLYLFRSFRKCPYNSADCVYAGNHIPRQDGTCIFGSHADFICYNANRLTFQQSYSRKSRCECVVLHFRSVYDYAYYWCFNTICGKMQDILDNYQERIRQLK